MGMNTLIVKFTELVGLIVVLAIAFVGIVLEKLEEIF